MPFDKTLINILHSMVKEENKIKDYKRRIRIKGVVKAKGATKKGNITLKIKKEGDEYNFTVIKSHKESFALAEKLNIGKSVSIEGIPKFRFIICTRIKLLDIAVNNGKQAKLNQFKEN